MKKITRNIATLMVLTVAGTTVATAQVVEQKVGDNNLIMNQNAVLEIESSNRGLLLPRLELTATDSFAPLTAHVEGMTVYNTATAGTGATAVTPGYYYNDGTKWVRVATGADAKNEPWFIQNTSDEATANDDNIYQEGKVAVGFTDADAVSAYQLEVKGDFKSEYTDSDGWIKGISNNVQSILGDGIIGMYSADNENFTMGQGNYDQISLTGNPIVGGFSLSTKRDTPDGPNAGTISAQNTALGMAIDMQSTNAADDRASRISLGGPYRINLTDKTTGGLGAGITISDHRGVQFRFDDATGATEGVYYFPRNNGTAGQVLTTDGSLMAQLSWADASTLVDINEPWRVATTTTEATANNQNIYQNGNVGIGNFSGQVARYKLDVRGTVRGGQPSSEELNATAAIGENSSAFGNNNRAGGGNSFAVGLDNNSSGYNAASIGQASEAKGQNSTAMGTHSIAASLSGTVIGSFNAMTIGFGTTDVLTDALFQVGNGTDDANRANALTILKNGNTAIGVAGTEATAKPTELLDLGGTATAGNGGLKIRNINSAAYTGDIETDKLVVADADGVLKTVAVSTIASTEPWKIQNTTNDATDNIDDIYQQGKVAIGFTDADAVSDKQFEVKGDIKSVTNTAGTYSVFETNNTDFGVPLNIMLTADNPDVLAATTYGAVVTHLNESALNAKGVNGDASMGVDNGFGLSSPRGEIRVNRADNTVTNAVIVGSNGETEVVDKIYLRSEDITAGTATRLLVDKADGVTFKHGAIGSPSGNYTFPQNNGTAGQVLVTDGAAPTLMTGAQLSWADASDLVDINEPWRVQGTTNEATANTENIFQLGSVAIGANTIPSITTGSGTVNPTLHVAGDVSTTGKFYTTSSVYADYVFEKYFDGKSEINNKYEFKSLDYIKEFVEKNKHLPGVTKIEDLLKGENGYMFDMTELSIQQLEKIEELFLHVIEQNEQINELKNQVEDNNKRLEILENLLLENNSK